MDKCFRRAAWLAVAAAVCMTLMGRIDLMAALRGDRFFLSMAAMIPLGALVVSIPERIRRRKEKRRSTPRGCILCFAGGLLLMLGAGLAGGGDGLMLTGVLQGSLSGYGFLAASAAAALVTARLCERRSRS